MKDICNPPQHRRENERVYAEIPVRVSEQIGLTRDVSASGIFFEIDDFNEIGTEISFELELDTPSGKMTLQAVGNIVRTESRGQKTGVAVKIVDSKFR